MLIFCEPSELMQNAIAATAFKVCLSATFTQRRGAPFFGSQVLASELHMSSRLCLMRTGPRWWPHLEAERP